MTNRIADLRCTLTTIEEARVAFRDYALLQKKLAVSAARLEQRIAKEKASLATLSAEDRQAAEERLASLAAFVDNHRDLFEDPRTDKSDFGEFGLRTVTDLVIDNPAALLEAVLDRGYDDCFEVIPTPIKPAIRKRLKAGETLPGCTLRTGDTVVCKVSSELIKNAVEAEVQ